jgi:LacI family transcriptional regulator
MNSAAKRIAILMSLNRLYDRQVIRGIARYVQSHTRWQIYVEEDPADKLPILSTWQGDGVIVDLDDTRLFQAIKKIKVPIVGIGRVGAPHRLPREVVTVRSDDQLIGQWAADHLMELGLKNYAYCGLPRRGPDPWVQARYEAFRSRLNELGFDCLNYGGRHFAARNWSNMLTALSQWLGNLPKPIGIMACNDSRARHVLTACLVNGWRVPDDVAVIGVDNDEMMCDLAIPSLSSIAQGTEQIGYTAAELLEQRLEKGEVAEREVVVPPIELIPRRSTETFGIADPIIARAAKYIREHASESVGVDEIARHVRVSRSTLDARFKKAFNRSVHDELMRMRLQIARRLLLTTKLSIAEVAERSGFSSDAYMNHVFRRELGDTPGVFRQRSR